MTVNMQSDKHVIISKMSFIRRNKKTDSVWFSQKSMK